MSKAVEILQLSRDEWGVYVYDKLIFTGTYQECVTRASFE
jgi:hypothetical protein